MPCIPPHWILPSIHFPVFLHLHIRNRKLMVFIYHQKSPAKPVAFDLLLVRVAPFSDFDLPRAESGAFKFDGDSNPLPLLDMIIS